MGKKAKKGKDEEDGENKEDPDAWVKPEFPEEPELWITLQFIGDNPIAFLDNVTIAITSATGQLFIYYTISNFGPVIFSMVRRYQLALSAYSDLCGCP